MSDAELERQRRLLHEAFTAGWQAALAVKVTSPGVLAVIETCFDLWLEEEVDEQGVLGLPFKRRYDLPAPKGFRLSLMRSRSAEPAPVALAQPAAPATPRPRTTASTGEEPARPVVEVTPPAQRTAPANESYDGRSREEGPVRTGS